MKNNLQITVQLRDGDHCAVLQVRTPTTWQSIRTFTDSRAKTRAIARLYGFFVAKKMGVMFDEYA